ncbi:Uncharacterised protein [Achromobacter sp. 2789STDY5608615]|nr:Uncharacterised protein [Achromobacter sp. 2789STDY5608621]CUK22805.1 Uncharacterised protein [Achromobacter sp. 2789STDY5608615]
MLMVPVASLMATSAAPPTPVRSGRPSTDRPVPRSAPLLLTTTEPPLVVLPSCAPVAPRLSSPPSPRPGSTVPWLVRLVFLPLKVIDGLTKADEDCPLAVTSTEAPFTLVLTVLMLGIGSRTTASLHRIDVPEVVHASAAGTGASSRISACHA